MAEDGSQTGTETRTNPRETRRHQRIRTACLRCQQRKIRCDGTLPTCTSCTKSKRKCEYQGGNVVDNQARARYIRHLEQRVHWLESIVKDRCPDVDLTQTMDVDDSGDLDNTTAFNPPPSDLAGPQNDVVHDIDVPDAFQNAAVPHVEPTANAMGASNVRSNNADSSIAHQIGLVSLPNGDDPRYIGPSSGHFFTQLVCTASALTKSTGSIRPGRTGTAVQRDSALAEKLLRDIHTPLPTSKELTQELTKAFFESVHQHLPFLHEPTHMTLVEDLYGSDEPDAVSAFQVYMVLAISSVTLSRRDRVVLPSEGWSAKAMSYFEKVPLESSIRGLQCLLLLYVWGMHSPSTKLNVWYLNYQCIAMVVDLGLQRDVSSTMTIPRLEAEMRTRLFWVVHSLDRSLCTMMGRPIGLRDEACDLRLPADLNDQQLTQTDVTQRAEGDAPSHMSYAIHMFKLSRLNSEMKYILHSISRETPAYAYPAIRCIKTWQRDMVSRLDEWAADIPLKQSRRDYVVKLCEIRYHVLKTLLLRPSPGIPQPTADELGQCYRSAIAAVRLYHELYIESSLVFSWASYHSIMMSSVTAFFCIWTCPAVAQETAIDSLVSDLRAASNILSATGEHWAGAKRSRDILDELAHRTISWLMDRRNRRTDDRQNAASATETSDQRWGSELSNANLGAPLPLDNPLGMNSIARNPQSDDLEALMQQYSRNWTPGLDFLGSGPEQASDTTTGFWTGDMNTDSFLQDIFDGLAPMAF